MEVALRRDLIIQARRGSVLSASPSLESTVMRLQDFVAINFLTMPDRVIMLWDFVTLWSAHISFCLFAQLFCFQLPGSKSPPFMMGSGLIAREDWMSVSLIITKALYAIYVFATLGLAVPTITFPINSQVPPVARVSIPFMFIFSESTFSGSSPLKYSMSNAPNWLSLNGSTRTLSGVAPSSAANTAPVIQITATDLTGSITMNTTLVVSGNPSPSVVIPLENQLAAFGEYSPPSSISYYPSTPFDITFDPETFGSSELNYYAVTSDNTPLPSWITFDGVSLSFSGKTPEYYSLVQPPQTWGLQLIASDVLGFAGIAIEFNVVVGNHELDFKDGILTVNATEGIFLNFTSLISSLYLDGNVAETSSIASADAATPDWLRFSNSTLTLSGTPPAGMTSFNVTVTVQDIYGDIANATVRFDATLSIFLQPAGSVNATIGTHFSYNIGSFFSNSSDVSVSLQDDPYIPWLSFDNQSLNLNGDVPADLKPSKFKITIQAHLKMSNISGTQVLTLNVVSKNKSAPSSTATVVATSTNTQNSVPTPNIALAGISASKTLSSGDIVAITVPIVLISTVLVFLLMFWYARKKHDIESIESSSDKMEISRPIPIWNQVEEELEEPDMTTNSDGFTSTTFSSNGHSAAFKKHSQAMSNIAAGLSTNLRDSSSSGARGRSYSENALSDFGSTWRYTQDSAYPPLRINHARSSVRNTRNFSRKTSAPITITCGSSADLSAPKISEKALKASRSSIQQTPDFAYGADIQVRRSRRRSSGQLSILGMDRRLSGIGHGSQKAAAGYVNRDETGANGGIGHGTYGQILGSQSNTVVRDRNSWLTVRGAELKAPDRRSAMSALTESTELLNSPGKITLRHIPKSPSQPATRRASARSRSSEPSSKRVVGSSPFFGGSSRTESRGKSRKHLWPTRDKYEYPSSPPALVYEAGTNGLEKSIIRGPRVEDPIHLDPVSNLPRDSLGINYGSPYEGTKQLSDYVSHLSRRASLSLQNSLQFSDNDSCFRSAEHSPLSQHSKRPGMNEDNFTYENENCGYSPGGSDSPISFNRDRYGVDESPELSQAVGARAVIRSNLPSPILNFSNSERQLTENGFRQETYVPDPSRPMGSYGYGMDRETSLTASHFDGNFDEVDDSLDGIHGAFL